MAQLISGPQVAKYVQKMLSGAEIRIAVAFWGLGATKELGLLSCHTAPKIICNLLSGGTNPNEIEEIQKALRTRFGDDFNIMQNDRLHAKVYLSTKGVIIGSSNASANGLSMEGRECSGWIEANLYSNQSIEIDDAGDWFSEVWQSKETRPITNNDIEIAKENWKRRRRLSLPERTTDPTHDLYNELQTNPANYTGKNLWFAIYGEPSSKEADDKILAERSLVKTLGMSPDDVGGFEDWDDIPNGADLICFDIGPRTRVTSDGIWRTPENRKKYTLSNGTELVVCYKSPLKLRTDNPKWKDIVNQLKKRNESQFPIEEIIRDFFSP